MKRVARLLLGPIALAGAAIAIATAISPTSTSQVAAIFDNARGMVPGQNVDIAGAKVGTIAAVDLDRSSAGGYEARLTLSVDRRVLPFRANATCEILPEGLISEAYVECNPGSSADRLLTPGTSGVPTVPLSHTAVPASLQDFLTIFSVPTAERLRVLINELGIGTAGRGEDLNAILRRSNPALAQARQVLSIVDAQVGQLVDATAQTDHILAALASRTGAVRGFVDRAARVVRTTAQHRVALGNALRNLPPMLDALKRTLAPIKRVASAGTPLLTDLRDAAPGLTALNEALPSFSAPWIAALHAVGDTARTGKPAVAAAAPVVSDLNALSIRAQPVANLLSELLVSFRDNGGSEGLGELVYGISTIASAFDSTSHTATVTVEPFPRCILDNMAPGKQTVAGCSHAYSAPGNGELPPSNVPSRADTGTLTSLLTYLLK